MSNYRYEVRGAIKYIYDGSVKLTGGHHEYTVESDGSITGKLGNSFVETVMSADGTWVINNGVDKSIADKTRQENSVLRYLNSL